ncbi:Hsp20/alpha crystallin family protein [Bacillus sp. FJAT-27251]|uniref:Hsp20/alpha crystallin family protein n=1 Tax=Bacillus sp. FJAT-27251 TaxID=1684142 RepID=UPI0006A762B6|nr:Hsp20/alpha crystallin family protein [Bacillus sp. FJAT-27251]
MDKEKIKKWLEITNQGGKNEFWTHVLRSKHPEAFIDPQEETPAFNVYQDGQYNYIIVEIPGVLAENLFLKLLSNKQLRISGKRTPYLPEELELKRESLYGDFERIIELPEETSPHLLTIQMHMGLLYISYPRSEASVVTIPGY